MSHICSNCSNQELIVESKNVFRHGFSALESFIKIETHYVCPNCRRKSSIEKTVTSAEQFPFTGKPDTDIGETRCRSAQLVSCNSRERLYTSIQFPAAFRVGENILFPISEGIIQDGTVIDRYGDPDLMMKFAEEYFRLYQTLMPRGELPNSLVKMMPILHILVTAAELAIKAYLIRADKNFQRNHSLQLLYDDLDRAHRDKIELRFAESDLNTKVATLGVKMHTVKEILGMYDNTYGGASSVYMDSRYYAEPTTAFRRSSNLHGANLVKSCSPYPIFLPEILIALIHTYSFFSGHERLKRKGGDMVYGVREPGSDNHGEWGLIPSSLNLVVLSVPQSAGISAENEKLNAFKKLLSENPPGFRTDWMYGGNTLLFYRASEHSPIDGRRVLNGVECRVWRHKRLGMHARDLYLLASTLESEAVFECLTDGGGDIDQ